MGVSLPSGVTFKKQMIGGKFAYVFRHKTLGELGRIVLHGLPDGQTNIVCEVVGDSDDPMTEARKKIIQPLSMQICNAMASVCPPSQSAYAKEMPHSPASPKEVVESKVMPCPHCGAPAAQLVFAYGGNDIGTIEDYARKMYPQYRDLDVPTWIIGPLLGPDSPETPAMILKVWPNREPIQKMTPNVFNFKLDKLLDSHCR